MKISTFCIFLFLGLSACNTAPSANNKAVNDNKAVDQKSIDAQLIAEYAKANGLKGQTTASGIYYVMAIIGDGDSAKDLTTDSRVLVHYHGTFLDGKVFDSSVNKGRPFDFTLSEVIAGWQEAVKLLNVGGKGTFIIPSHLAYGTQGYPGLIAPNTVLKFDMQLLGL